MPKVRGEEESLYAIHILGVLPDHGGGDPFPVGQGQPGPGDPEEDPHPPTGHLAEGTPGFTRASTFCDLANFMFTQILSEQA